MEKPEQLNICPFCGTVKKLLIVKKAVRHIVPPNLFIGWFWVYECQECGQGFTTNGSDTISLKHLKQRKL